MSEVSLDIELVIRMLEWAREEAGDDVDLHIIAERMEGIGHPLTMADYPAIVGNDHTEPVLPTHEVGTRDEPDHTLIVKYDSKCFEFGEFVRTLWILGGWGSSRGIKIEDASSAGEKGYKTSFFFDGDGADKIWFAELDGEDLLEKARFREASRFVTVDELRKMGQDYLDAHPGYTAEQLLRGEHQKDYLDPQSAPDFIDSRASASIGARAKRNYLLSIVSRLPYNSPEFAEFASFWDELSPREKRAYLKKHPRSHYGSRGGIREHLESTGWQQNGKVWVHPKSKRKLIHVPSTTHKHHVTVTHANGDITRHRTNSDAMLKRLISKMARKQDNSGIARTLNSGKGSLHDYFGMPHDKPIPLGHLEKLAKTDHPLAGRAQLVLNLKRKRMQGPVDYQAVSSDQGA